jgi:multidrug efflux pump subunit AcrA (membrane-fusion protein)
VIESTGNKQREPAKAEAPSRNGPGTLRDRVQALRLPNREPEPRSVASFVPWLLCLVLLGTTVALAMRQPPTAAAETEEELLKRDESLATGEASGGMSLQPGDAMLESKGYIVPITTIQVSPKVGGMVLWLHPRFKEGALFRKGEKLAELEKIEYTSDRDRTKGLVDAARSRYDELALSLSFQIKQAEADLVDASAQYDAEYVQLQGEIRSQQGTSKVDVMKRKAGVESKQAKVSWYQNQVDMIHKGSLACKVAAAKAELEQNLADLVKAQWRFDNCVIVAPVDGTILVKRTEEGNLVNPSAYSNGLSASLCDMADLSLLEVDMSIPERDVARLIDFRQSHAKKQKCQVRADAFPNRPYEGFVSRIMPQGDRGKGAVPVRVQIVIDKAQAGIYLRPEMGAAVTFLNAESAAADAYSNSQEVPSDAQANGKKH